jgi:hypothetical protein
MSHPRRRGRKVPPSTMGEVSKQKIILKNPKIRRIKQYPRVYIFLNNNLEASLTGFVTKVSENKVTPNLVSNNMREGGKLVQKNVDQSKINPYYMQGLYKAFMKKSNDYFSNLYRVHFNQSLQFLNVKKGLNLNGYVPNGKLAFIPGGREVSKIIRQNQKERKP